MEAEVYSLQTRNGGHRKTSLPRSSKGSCSVSVWLRLCLSGSRTPVPNGQETLPCAHLTLCDFSSPLLLHLESHCSWLKLLKLKAKAWSVLTVSAFQPAAFLCLLGFGNTNINSAKNQSFCRRIWDLLWGCLAYHHLETVTELCSMRVGTVCLWSIIAMSSWGQRECLQV